MELYRRGKSVGVRDLETGRNHRLDTLGLSDAFSAMNGRFSSAPQAATKSQQTAPAKPSLNTSQTLAETPTQETDVDLLQAALQGVSAIADALSITTDLGKPIDDQKRKVQSAAQTILKPTEVTASAHTTRPPPEPAEPVESEAERIARERLSEIAATREEQDRQRDQSQDNRLKR
jgi:hypothetical protein